LWISERVSNGSLITVAGLDGRVEVLPPVEKISEPTIVRLLNDDWGNNFRSLTFQEPRNVIG
jgi:hypothetical protein